ncbi:UDP-glucose 4-epimerase GalE [Mycetocola manganoxydans]|uniref:UDP-glucose 4-epimerase n=1 Tax=Mycetocola manganoxydans TaxID=699879 RepID=A0A3L7A1N0_9MICO|nr:UDP-glucose 4-epimerase GalE [Mycetocola manganoxydans]RLP73885.1 UDP-glucose 4-epimerase GalE [Mycetocola manganoxydans]GHD42522.1 UDP-glucose 4-epimerase GalE [Mycetocola manganoxydans]
MSVLVTGGAGYIGSHIVRLLREQKEEAVVVDSLASGDASRVGDVPLAVIDLASEQAPRSLRTFIDQHDVSAVIHLAALKQVGQSVEQPARYYRENVGGLANVLLAIEGSSVDRFVFSSSAAVYGSPEASPVTEDAPTNPVNPYGQTKLAGEWLVAAAADAQQLRTASLRYFNVAGAGWPELADTVPMNLLTLAIDAVHRGESPRVFGDDFNTPDGTGVRDYVHVLDLAEAHIRSLNHLADTDVRSTVLNVGTGTGASVLEVLDTLSVCSGRTFRPVVQVRRAGDPATVVADVTRMQEALGWTARRNLTEMVGSAWEASLLARPGMAS